MKDVTVNRIAFCPEDYEHGDEDKMWQDIMTMERILIRNGYHCRLWTDGFCTCIDYDYANPELCDNSLMWIHLDDLELLEALDNATQDIKEDNDTFDFD